MCRYKLILRTRSFKFTCSFSTVTLILCLGTGKPDWREHGYPRTCTGMLSEKFPPNTDSAKQLALVLMPVLKNTTTDLLIVFFYITDGAVLDDYPDSPGLLPIISSADANSILDSEEPPQAMDTTTGRSGCLASEPAHPGVGDRKRKNSTWNEPISSGPYLPPIYHSVVKKRLSKNVVRHLDGNAYNEADSTTSGASASQMVQVGSFANDDDKRHNHTTHRHDHTNARNISTSFDPSTFDCNTCQGVHKVLHRTVDGTDVGQSSPPVFVLTDQNFPPMVPVGGEGECLKILQIENGTLVELVEAFLGLTRWL
jgi:hypothetical protein